MASLTFTRLLHRFRPPRLSRLSLLMAAGFLVHALPPPAEACGAGNPPADASTFDQSPPRARKPRVLLDNFYNNEWRTDSMGNRVRFHYLWHDTTNSGFSILGRILHRAGVRTDTLCRRPDAGLLRKADIYIIVDPDTPKETDHPEIIDSSAADVIAAWVARGGTLVLLGNDRGNCDLAGFSVLGSRFGIRFNEDSRNRVVKDAFQAGTFDKLPAHPVFRGVRKVYVKEVSTLALTPPAKPLLTDSGHVIIATARFGKGFVFAVGDPWFYDEYMDARRLPADYDNMKAAANLFRWLLDQRKGRQR
jgi:unsaturated rhamnogalacturonyl hydrolase